MNFVRTLILSGLILLVFTNATQANETKGSSPVEVTILQGHYIESVIHQFHLSNYSEVTCLADNYVELQGVIDAQAMRQAEIKCNTYMVDETFSKSDWSSLLHFYEQVLRASSVEQFATTTRILEKSLLRVED